MPSLLLSLPSISLLWVTVLSVFSFALHFVSLSLLYSLLIRRLLLLLLCHASPFICRTQQFEELAIHPEY